MLTFAGLDPALQRVNFQWENKEKPAMQVLILKHFSQFFMHNIDQIVCFSVRIWINYKININKTQTVLQNSYLNKLHVYLWFL